MTGYVRPLWMPPEYLPPGDVPNAPPFVPAGVAPIPGIPGDLPPAAPAYEAPNLTPAAPLSFRDQLGLSMAGVPQFNGPLPQENGLQAFARGLVGGVGTGMSTSTAADIRQRETARTEGNAVRKSESDRNYVNAIETWKAKLKKHYGAQADADDSGKVVLTPRMALDMGVPYEKNKRVDVLEASRAISQRTTSLRQPAPKEPKPPKPPKSVSPSEQRRKYVGGIVADLFRGGRRAKADVSDYLAMPGVVDTLASHGITPADILREFPE